MINHRKLTWNWPEIKKSRIQETLNISTNADSITIAMKRKNLKGASNLFLSTKFLQTTTSPFYQKSLLLEKETTKMEYSDLTDFQNK